MKFERFAHNNAKTEKPNGHLVAEERTAPPPHKALISLSLANYNCAKVYHVLVPKAPIYCLCILNDLILERVVNREVELRAAIIAATRITCQRFCHLKCRVDIV